MNLSWAEKIAKNALLTAQKRIDSVLDIKTEESEENVDEVKSDAEDAVSGTQIDPVQEEKVS